MDQDKIIREIKKYLWASGNEDTTYQNVWNASKSVLTENFTAINVYIRKEK